MRIDRWILFGGVLFMTMAAMGKEGHQPSESVAKHGMVASAHPLASEAGLKTLMAGGNAVDAAIATALALNVVEPHCSGIGGGGFIVLHLADGRSEVMDFRETAPQAATPGLYYDQGKLREDWVELGGRSVAVPTEVRAFYNLLNKYGKRDFAHVSQPAISLARDGFIVTENLSKVIDEKAEVLAKQNAAASIYLNKRKPFQPGERMSNPDLAKTLEAIAKEGPSLFYEGDIAKAILKTVNENGGVMSAEDLLNYKTEVAPPVTGSYRGYEIISMPPPSSGGTTLIQILKMVETYDLNMEGPVSADTIHRLAEAMKLAFADREQYMGDPRYNWVPVEKLLSEEHIKQLVGKIDPTAAAMEVDLGANDGSPNTTHLSVVDRWGNAVAMTLTINHWFGSGLVVPGYGFLLNDEMADFSFTEGSPNAVEGGKRPLSSMAPTIVLKDDKPYLVLGSPGATRIITAMAQIVVNLIEFGMPIDDAIEAPRFHSLSSGGKASPLYLESRFSEDTLQRLEKMGHKLDVKDAYDSYFGGAQGILIDTEAGMLRGGADSRRDGACAGY